MVIAALSRGFFVGGDEFRENYNSVEDTGKDSLL